MAARAFSGVWAAVGSTAQVYLADVANAEMLPHYMAQLGAMTPAAQVPGRKHCKQWKPKLWRGYATESTETELH